MKTIICEARGVFDHLDAEELLRHLSAITNAYDNGPEGRAFAVRSSNVTLDIARAIRIVQRACDEANQPLIKVPGLEAVRIITGEFARRIEFVGARNVLVLEGNTLENMTIGLVRR